MDSGFSIAKMKITQWRTGISKSGGGGGGMWYGGQKMTFNRAMVVSKYDHLTMVGSMI